MSAKEKPYIPSCMYLIHGLYGLLHSFGESNMVLGSTDGITGPGGQNTADNRFVIIDARRPRVLQVALVAKHDDYAMVRAGPYLHDQAVAGKGELSEPTDWFGLIGPANPGNPEHVQLVQIYHDVGDFLRNPPEHRPDFRYYGMGDPNITTSMNFGLRCRRLPKALQEAIEKLPEAPGEVVRALDPYLTVPFGRTGWHDITEIF